MTEDPYDLQTELPGIVVPRGDSHQRADATLRVGVAGVHAITARGEEYLVPWKGIRLDLPDSQN